MPAGSSDPEPWIYSNLTPVQEMVHAEHLLKIELRESSILVAGAGLALLAPSWWSTAAPHIEATES